MSTRRNPNGHRWLAGLCAIALLGLTAVSSPGFSAAPAVQQDEANRESVSVVVLQHAACDEMARVLREMVPEAKVSFDPRTNAVLVKTTDQYHTVVRDYIARLDRPVEERQNDRRVEVIQFQNTSLTVGIQRALIEMFGGRNVKMSLDPDRNTLVVESDGATLDRIRELIGKLDKKQNTNEASQAGEAAGSYRVRIVWLVTGAAADEGERPVPADLQPVVEELDKLGVKNLQVAAQMLTRVRMNQQFIVHATPTLSQPVQLESVGTLIAHGNTRPELRIEIDARRETEPTQGQNQAARRTEMLAALKTTIDAPVGHFVVLGVTPIGPMTSVFVVQLQPGEQEAAEDGGRRVW